ncbi:MAG: hypothetical protein ACK56F_20670, partial [bacterium]
AFVAGDPVDLQPELAAQIQKERPQDVHRQQGGFAAVGGVAQQLIEAPVGVEEIAEAGDDDFADAIAAADLLDPGGQLGQPGGGHREVVAVGGQIHLLVEVQVA